MSLRAVRLLALLAAWTCSSMALAQSAPAAVQGIPESIGTSASAVDVPPKPAPGAAKRAAAVPEIVRTENAGGAIARPDGRPDARSDGRPEVRQDARATGNLGPITRPLVRTGDEWIYRRVSGTTSALLRQRVTQVDFDSISLITELTNSVDTTTAVYNREWGLLGSGYNTYVPALAYYAFPLYPGKRWRIDSAVSNFGAGQTGRIEGEGAVLGFEEVETAAGKFLALKVTAEFETGDPGDNAYRVKVRETHWYARDVLRVVRVESVTQAGTDPPRRETIELVKFKIE